MWLVSTFSDCFLLPYVVSVHLSLLRDDSFKHEVQDQ